MPLQATKLQNLVAFSCLWIQLVFGAVFFQSPDELPGGIDYDFIVAGGGTAGGVVAARLAENPAWNVLIIEAGPSNLDVFATIPPNLRSELAGTIVDWNYTTTAQPGLNERTTTYGRARMLGGCSSHNGMAYTRGSRDDWDSWARATGNRVLAWDSILPFMFKAEKLVQDSENQSEQDHLDPAVHGHTGPLSVTAPYSIHPLNDMMLTVTKELSEEFPFVLDMNAGKPIGISWSQFTVDHNAARSSSATAYVETSVNNLHVLLNTYVTRVLQVGNASEFRGVEFAPNAQSARKQLTAKKEVIITGGVIGTPQILLNSGIGDREELEAIGVKVLVDNPSVGKNFTDQVSATVTFNTTLPTTDFDLEAALAEWNETRTGPMGNPTQLDQIVWVRLPSDAPPFSQDGFPDPSPGENAPHIEIYPSQINTPADLPLPPGTLGSIKLSVTNLHVASRGSITLSSSDPFADPLIDPGLLTEDVDLAILREGIRSARRLYSAPVFTDFVFESITPASNVTTDEDLDTFLRASALPFLHGGCSAEMTPWGASWGVVNPDFRVKETTGLRVVDTSILPSLPSGHTQAAVYGIAELASALMVAAWTGSS